jgi:hypothetical protein
VALVATVTAAGAEAPPSTVPGQLKAMQACSFLAGKWAGEGWIGMDEGQRKRFHETESIDMKLGGLVLLIQGHGTDDAGRTVHAALATLSFDMQDQQYHFRAHEDMGHYIDSTAQCRDKVMTWSLPAGPGKILYTIALNAKGQWHETGTFTVPGQPERPMFEMTLERASEP